MIDAVYQLLPIAEAIEIVVLVGFAICLLWLLIITFFVIKSLRYSQKLFGDTSKKGLREILHEHLDRVGNVQTRVNNLETSLHKLEEQSKFAIVKLGLVRFNPYGDTGGNQSFAIALLDEEDCGMVISSLHGRDRTRMYAKAVVNGKEAEFEFSSEEQEAVQKAQRRK